MQQCAFYTADFTRCKSKTSGKFCGTHLGKAIQLGAYPRAELCACVRVDHWCGEPKQEGHDICADHVARIQAREDRRVAQKERIEKYKDLIQTEAVRYATQQMSWQQVTRDCYRRAEMVTPKHPDHLPFKVATTIARAFFHTQTQQTSPDAFIYFWGSIGCRIPFDPPLNLIDLVLDPPDWWKE
jgi:hypothetical protein